MRLSFSLAVIILFIACAGNEMSGDNISGQDYEQGSVYGYIAKLPVSKIYLYGLYGDEVNLLDSAVTDAMGNYQFLFPQSRSNGLYRMAMGRNSSSGHSQYRQQFDIIWDGTAVVFRTHYASPVDSMKIILSEENRLYYNFLRIMRNYDRKMNVLNSALLHYPRGDNFYRRLERQHRRVQNRRSNYIDNIVKKNRSTIFASLALFQKPPRVSTPGSDGQLQEIRDDFFYEGQFDDPVLLHTDLIPRKIVRYLSLYTGEVFDDERKEDEMIEAVDVIMSHASSNEDIYYYVLEYLMNGFKSMDMDIVSEHLDARYLPGEICLEEGGLSGPGPVASIAKMEVGDRVPGFSFESSDGRMIDLYEIESDYTLILFWGSWCPHCEDIMDDLYRLYSEHKMENENFLEIVAIGIEDDGREWLEFIERGGYDWINYSSLARWDCPVAREFDLRGTPTMILLDRNKRFIREHLRVRSLSRYLSRQ